MVLGTFHRSRPVSGPLRLSAGGRPRLVG
jgi:hypothetical protein